MIEDSISSSDDHLQTEDRAPANDDRISAKLAMLQFSGSGSGSNEHHLLRTLHRWIADSISSTHDDLHIQ